MINPLITYQTAYYSNYLMELLKIFFLCPTLGSSLSETGKGGNHGRDRTARANGKRPYFADIAQSLGEALQAKENRGVRTLIKPRPLYEIRNEIDHAGYKMKISQEQAQAIFVLVKDIVDDLRL